MEPRSWVEVDHGAILRNARTLRRVVGAGVELLGVVKANAYGHGALEVARTLVLAGIERLGVSDLNEAIALRNAGVRVPIHVLSRLLPDEAPEAIAHELTVTVHAFEDLEALVRALERVSGRSAPYPLHLMVDTGMGRLGCRLEAAVGLAAAIARTPRLFLEGVATHFARADEPDRAPTERQLERFEALLGRLRRMGLRPPRPHAAATAALLRFPKARYRLCRPGIGLYGIDPCGPGVHSGVRLEPALSWRARIVHLKRVDAGHPIGYGGLDRTVRPTRLATLACGYHDGYPLASTGARFQVLLEGKRAPVLGRTSMDHLVVDATDCPEVRLGSVATLIGRSGEAAIGVEELATRSGTIPYELLCRIGPRVVRRHNRPAELGVRQRLGAHAGATSRRVHEPPRPMPH